MAKELKLQDPGEGIHEVEIQDVLVSTGDRVEEGQSVLVVESDKAAVEIPSPHTGVVGEIRAKAGDVAEVGDVLMTFDEAAAEGAEPTGPAREEPRAEEAAPEEEKEEVREQEAPELQEPERPERARAGERQGPVPAAPATRRLAGELGVDLQELEPSGPDGRVLDDDVRAAAGAEPQPEAREPAGRQPRPLRAVRPEAPPLPDFAQWGEVEREPLRSIRRASAEQMARSWSQIPHVVHQDVADVTELEDFRRRNADEVEAQGGKLTLTVFALKAAVAALKACPRFNASLDVEAGEIILKRYFHIGVAIDTKQGLIVPVVRDVDRKSVSELALELYDLAERTRSGAARREEMAGGTFTITNVGPLGGTAFAPIINYPEVAILGLARTRLVPVIQGEPESFEIAARRHLPLCLAFDHRVVDGAEAARFVRTVAETLADVEALTLRT